MQVATNAARRAIQFPGLFVGSTDAIWPIQRNVQRAYANEVRDGILRCTYQTSGTQGHNRRVQFLAGVEVREISMEDWIKASNTFKAVWLG
ncbi:hypothetical protein ACS5PN_26560 [Roseateles sp. NT4]|uniref:hypothetical protein n=1 Tax=Roseateles sp. NT4 TaxID=3453715 RepID=UPI003EE8E53B